MRFRFSPVRLVEAKSIPFFTFRLVEAKSFLGLAGGGKTGVPQRAAGCPLWRAGSVLMQRDAESIKGSGLVFIYQYTALKKY